MADWVTISALASAGGTLVLAGVTVASVRSANRAARVAEQSLLAGQRPLLVPSRAEDPTLKVNFSDDVWFSVPGGQGMAKVTDEAVYFVIDIRNVGLMGAVEVAPRKDGVAARGYDVMVDCFNRGLYLRMSGDSFAMSPPLIVEKSHIDEMVSILGDAIKRVA